MRDTTIDRHANNLQDLRNELKRIARMIESASKDADGDFNAPTDIIGGALASIDEAVTMLTEAVSEMRDCAKIE